MSDDKENKKPWVDTIRRESGLIENICEHGVGHPVYGSIHWMELNGKKGMGVHGCDGCCSSPEWQIEELKESVRIANGIIMRQNKKIREICNLKAFESAMDKKIDEFNKEKKQ